MQERHVQGTTVFSFLRSLIPLLFVSFASLGLLSAADTAWAAAPAAPTNLTATMASSRQINLAWTDNATTETNYYVERSPNGSSSWTVVATLGANITSYQNTGLTLSTIYYYRVRCQAGSTYSSYSNTANATTATLAAPTSLTASVASSTQITLVWADNTTYETQYSIESSPNGSSSWTVLGTVATNVTTTTNSGLTVGTAYYYRVRAYDSTNYSAYSNTANQTIRSITASAGANGAIAPSGTVGVANASNKSFTMTPNSGYKIATVTVDGSSVATNPTYTFSNITANHTISATFSISTYTITASAGANGTISPSGSVVVSGGTSTTFTMTPNSGYKIATVTVDGSSVATNPTYTFSNVTANHTISATFSVSTYTITASAGANGTISPSGSVVVSAGSSTTFTMTPNSGYKIATVTVDGSSVATNPTYTFSNVTTNHTISATFSANTVTITASAGANGTINPSGAVAVPFGASQPFTITPNPNYHISDVSVDLVSVGTPSLYTFPSVTTAHSIAAGFAINTFTINATAGANGSISPSGAYIVTSGTTPTFTATPNAGYRILDVQVDGASVGSSPTYTFAPVTANHTIAATFAVQTYTITATAGANGAISPSGSVVVSAGTSTSFTITPNANYHISDVSVDGASVGTPLLYTFPSVTSTHSILASFAVNTFTISAGAGDNGSISPSGAVIISSGSTPTFTATPNAGYHILDVQVDGSSVGSAPTYTFAPVTANHTISALFSVNSYTISAGAGANGTISPSGVVLVSAGSSTTFTFLPNAGYHVSDVLVDNASVGAPPSYTFPNVTATHSILASFAVNTYTITAAANTNGAIDPSGAIVVSAGTSTTFAFTPNAGYHISDVQVDGASVGTPTVYTFPAVVSNHTITASFSNTYPITAAFGANGTITPSGTVDAPQGTNQTFTITPNATYHINDIIVDGASVGKVPSYTFFTVAGAHSITASFAADTVISGGTITTDTTWTLAGSPYVVNGMVTVAGTPTTPATLTIEAGVVVRFTAYTGLTIGSGTNQGALASQGTSTNRVTLTMNETSGYWSGITFNDATVDASTVIEDTDILSSGSINMNSASPTIRNSTIAVVTGDGMWLTNSNPVLENVSITSGQNRTIYLSTSSPTITGCNIVNTSVNGNGIEGIGSPIISSSTITVTNPAGRYGVTLSTTTSSLSITNSTISNGLYIDTTGISPTITGNTINGADLAPIHAGANIIDQIMDNNTVNGMTSDGRIEVVGEVINRSVRWKNWLVPYWILNAVDVYNDATTAAQLTIDPGVTMKFAPYTRINVGGSNGTDKGMVIAQGTSAERITFTRSGASGWWNGFMIFGASNGTIFENADIEHTNSGIAMYSASPVFRNSTINDQSAQALLLLTGSNPILDNVAITANGSSGINMANSSPVITGGSLINVSSTGYGIYGSGSPMISDYTISIVNTPGKYGIALSGATSNFAVTNSTIGNGLYLSATGIMPTITGNTFTNADNSPLRAGANIIDLILDNNTMTGLTSAGRIEVVGETVTRDVRWKKWAAPYYFPNGYVYVYRTDGTTATMTIDPGVTLKFDWYGLNIGGTGRGMLVARGAADNMIVFTSGQAGTWSGVSLSGNAASASVIEHAIFENGGSNQRYFDANLAIDSASPVIRNSIFRNSAASGVYVNNGTAWPTIIDSEITGNRWGVYSSSSNPVIVNSTIFGNTTAGVYNNSATMDVEARGNWWGTATGPQHASNPPGTGDIVTNHVFFNPWLGQAPGSGFRFTDLRVNPAALNPEGDYVVFSASITSSATWTITIMDNSNTVVRTLTGNGAVINQKWYGENDQAVPVSDGDYYYRVTAVNPATGESALAPLGLIMVSRQLPIAILDPPTDNQMFRVGETINVTGTAADPVDFKYYTLEYGEGENPASWNWLVWQQIGTTPITNGPIYTWDTSSLTGSIYSLRLTVTDNAGNIAVETSRVRFLKIQNALVSEPYISPNNDGVKDTTIINAAFTQPSDWTITLKDSSSAVVKTFTGVASSVTQTWDGKNEQNQTVPDGAYTWTLSAVGSGTTTTADPASGTVTVDTVLPLAAITAPSSGAVLWNLVPVSGTASDLNLENYRIEYGPTDGSGPWSMATQGAASVTSGPLGIWVTNDATNAVLVASGNYLLRLVVTDKAGNNTISTVPVGVSNLILSNISASSHTLDTYQGETSTLSYSISSSATVTLKVIPERQGPTGTPVYQASQTIAAAGSYSFTWNGINNAGKGVKVVPDEAYLYVLEASDGTKTDSYSPDAPTGTGTMTCSQSTGFDFAKNLPMTVTYTPVQASRVNISISWGSQNFKIQDAVAATSGSHTYVWDGRNASNKLLDTGAESSCSVASFLGENFIITTGDTVRISELKTDPYMMHLSYGQFTRIKYTLSRDANITIKLTSPSGTVFTIVNSQPQIAGPQEIDWNGTDPADTTGKNELTADEGDYMVSVQAVNPSTGTSSTARGMLRIKY